MKILTVMFAFLGACLLSRTASAQDAVQVAPKMNKVLLDNDRVRVLDVSIEPGDKMPMHSHPDNILYVISAGSTKSTDANGKTTDHTYQPGECVFRKAETHAVENTGKTATHVIDIELKH